MKLKFFIFVLFFTANLSAQQYIIRAIPIITNNDSAYTIRVQIKMGKSEETNLGNATMRFSYDSHELTYPNLPTKGIDYAFNLKNTGQYLCSVTKPEPGKISINIYFKKGVPQIITNKYYNLVTIKFNKKKEFANFKINKYTAEIFSPNKQKPWQLKIFLLGFQSNISSERMQ